jgi:hypothetical protein
MSGPAAPRFYEFKLHTPASGGSASQLCVIELDDTNGTRLELLDVGGEGASSRTAPSCSPWGAALPARLRELCSHWLCRTHRAVLLRPRHFQQREVLHLMTAEAHGAGAGAGTGAVWWDCRRVPRHLRSAPDWRRLASEGTQERAQLCDRLVEIPDNAGAPEGAVESQPPTDSTAPNGAGVRLQRKLRAQKQRAIRRIISVLSKFEDACFIHVYEPCGASLGHAASGAAQPQVLLRYELPRYRMEFDLTADGKLLSRDYAGYELRPAQQLVEASVHSNSSAQGTYITRSQASCSTWCGGV